MPSIYKIGNFSQKNAVFLHQKLDIKWWVGIVQTVLVLKNVFVSISGEKMDSQRFKREFLIFKMEYQCTKFVRSRDVFCSRIPFLTDMSIKLILFISAIMMEINRVESHWKWDRKKGKTNGGAGTRGKDREGTRGKDKATTRAKGKMKDWVKRSHMEKEGKKRIKRNSIEMETEISKKIDTITVLLKWSDRAKKAIRQ